MNAPAELKPASPPADGRGAIDPQRQRQVVAALRAALPEHCLLYREEDTRPYECDALTLYRQLPMVVALPETVAQVRQVLRICHALG
ncbi:MAG: FAD-binding oxidoreductase, partial [Burkholderiaceae bacterium]|nr:FAD-binding oxidoreductase [Burkholderiaceae bacterium]